MHTLTDTHKYYSENFSGSLLEKEMGEALQNISHNASMKSYNKILMLAKIQAWQANLEKKTRFLSATIG